MEPQDKNENKLLFDPTPGQLQAFIAKYKQELTAEDLKWYEELPDLVPFEDVITEIEDFIRRENLEGNENGST